MIILEDMKACYGCGACFNICGTSAISMQANSEGFLAPVINNATCVECGKCQEVCPALHPHFSNSNSPQAFAFVADKDTMEISSSGGAFSLLARETLAQGGTVFGAAYDENLEVKHIAVESTDNLHRLHYSKYVQSDQGGCYRQAKQLLEQGRKVIYSGCPCQIAGLKGFLGKSYDNLCAVDLLCMGTPSPGVYQDYLNSFFGPEPIESVEMRVPGKWSTCFTVKRKDGTVETRTGNKDPYIRAFTAGLTERPTCIGCAFARLPRQGDITLGDFWSAKKHAVGAPFEARSSVVLINSEAGKQQWEMALQQTEQSYQLLDLTETPGVGKLNRNINKPVAFEAEKRNAFFEAWKKKPFAEAAMETLHGYDVGLVLFMANNYGSTATNVALYTALEKMGYSPVIVDTISPPTTNGVAELYIKDNCAISSTFLGKGDEKSVNALCDTFIVGSDQSWRWDFQHMETRGQIMLLGFADSSKRKISYAASFGPERYKLQQDKLDAYRLLLRRFDAISVRENYAVSMCERLFGVQAQQVADPVFLIDRDDYLAIADKAKNKPEGNYLFAYILDPNPEKKALIEVVAQKKGLRAVVVLDARFYDQKRLQMNMEETIDKPPFEEWLALFAHASHIVTDSFHGACFSLIFQKPFSALRSRTLERFDSLQAMALGNNTQEEALFFDSTDEVLEHLDRNLNWDLLGSNLAKQAEAGRAWLSAALQAPPHAKETTPNHASLARFARIVQERDRMKKRIAQQTDPALIESINKWTKEEHLRRRKRQTAIPFTSHSHAPLEESDLASCTNVVDYFKRLGKLAGLLVVIAGNDDCSINWDRFRHASGLPLKTKPHYRDSYIALIKDGKLAYEKSSADLLLKSASYRITGKRSLNAKRWGPLSKLPIHRQVFNQIHILATSGGFGVDGGTASIRVNNLEYGFENQRGVSIAIIDLDTASVFDSFSVDLFADPNLTIRR